MLKAYKNLSIFQLKRMGEMCTDTAEVAVGALPAATAITHDEST